MHFTYLKSTSIGPFRVNASKSGVDCEGFLPDVALPSMLIYALIID